MREILALGFVADRVLVQHGFNEIDDQQLLDELQRFHPDAIFLGMGTPKQFDWIYAYRDANLAPLIVATGGFLDFVAGSHRRAPMWMRAARIEWLYRLLLEPTRLWKRYLIGIPRFLIALMCEFIRSSRR